MTLEQLKKEIKALKNSNNAYNRGLELLQELKPYRESLTMKQYKKLENAIQEERFKDCQ